MLFRRLVLKMIVSLSLGAMLAGCSTVPGQEIHGPALWMISIDGLRPEHYLPGSEQSPNLAELARKGAHAASMEPIYPSVTYPNHTSLVTGVYSDRHRILSNRIFDPEKGPLLDWYWDSARIQARTLWDAARESGLSAALVNWPVTVGAKADWVIPEVFPRDNFRMSAIWEETVRATQPKVLQEVLRESEVAGFIDTEQHDAWLANAAKLLARDHSPRLLLLHLTQLDVAQHFNRGSSSTVAVARRNVDELVGKVLSAFDFARDCVFVVGDHGFIDVNATVRPNTLFVRKGWIRAESGAIQQWSVVAHPSGAQAAVFARDPKLAAEALAALKPWSKGRFRILSRAELDRLHALPGASFALEPEEGWSISGDLRGTLIETFKEPHGEHGQLPNLPKMRTGFIAAGACALTPGKNLGAIRLIDVAPTAAKFLGLRLPEAQGTAFKLDDGP